MQLILDICAGSDNERQMIFTSSGNVCILKDNSWTSIVRPASDQGIVYFGAVDHTAITLAHQGADMFICRQ